MSYQDEWKLDSGLREAMDFTIVNPYFSTNAGYEGGQRTLLYLGGFDEKNEPAEMFMSVGADWTTADGGKTITHPTKTRVNKNSIYGHWLQHALEIPELRDILFTRGSPRAAEVWNNLTIHLELIEIKFGRDVKPVERLMPISFIGIYEDDAPSIESLTAASIPATFASTTPTPAEMVAAAKAAQSAPNLRDQMITLAKSSSDFPTFLSAALAIPAVLADDVLVQQVADEGGIWTAAH